MMMVFHSTKARLPWLLAISATMLMLGLAMAFLS